MLTRHLLNTAPLPLAGQYMQIHEAVELALLMGQNKTPFSKEQNHRGDEVCDAYWYSLQRVIVDPLSAGSHRERKQQQGAATSPQTPCCVPQLLM